MSNQRDSNSNAKVTPIRNATMRALEFARSLGGLYSQLRDGIGFRGNRDLYTVFGYQNVVTFNMCWAKYRRGGIAKRIVEMPADAIWSYPPAFKGSKALTSIIADLESRLSLWQTLNRADRLSAMDNYATILVGIDDGRGLDQPVNPNRVNKITYLQPYSASSLIVSQLNTDTSSLRFGKPLFYNLRQGQINTQLDNSILTRQTPLLQNAQSSLVHYSRVIHIADGVLENEIFGSPRLLNVYNLLDDLLKVGGGSAEIYWLNARGGLHIDVDKDMDLQEEDEEALTAEVDDYVNNQRRVMRTRGVTVTPVNMTMSDPRMPFEVIISQLSGSTGIPQRLMLGSEAGQLASEQDRANWATTTKQRRQNFAEPHAIRPLLLTLVGMGILTEQDITSTEVLWPEAFQMSPLERAQTSAQQARSAANLIKAVVTTPATPAVAAVEAVPATDTSPAIPGTPAIPGDPGQPALVSIEEARAIIFLGYNTNTDQPETAASAADLS